MNFAGERCFQRTALEILRRPDFQAGEPRKPEACESPVFVGVGPNPEIQTW
jgi:hypothetical protein